MKKNLIVTIIAIVLAFVICTISGVAAFIDWHDNWTEKQNVAHEIAELARSIDLPEADPIITRAQAIWLSEVSNESPTIDFYNGILSYDITYNAETEYLAIMLAKTVWAEARGIYSTEEQAAVIQTVYNRTRSPEFHYPTLYEALTAPNQFAYYDSSPTVDDYGKDLVALARDVMYRNTFIDQGYTEDEVGIVLAPDYYYYSGDGYHNYFRNAYRNGTRWNWSLPNPYES